MKHSMGRISQNIQYTSTARLGPPRQPAGFHKKHSQDLETFCKGEELKLHLGGRHGNFKGAKVASKAVHNDAIAHTSLDIHLHHAQRQS